MMISLCVLHIAFFITNFCGFSRLMAPACQLTDGMKHGIKAQCAAAPGCPPANCEGKRNRVQPVFLIAVIVLIMVELLVLEEPMAVGRVAA